MLFGALSAVVFMILGLFMPFDRDTFFGMNPLLSGFLTALITAALLEELFKYVFFRLAVRKCGEAVCWLDAIIAALPHVNYLVPMLICAIAVFVITFIALIVTAIKISRWSKRGEKLELLQTDNA